MCLTDLSFNTRCKVWTDINDRSQCSTPDFLAEAVLPDYPMLWKRKREEQGLREFEINDDCTQNNSYILEAKVKVASEMLENERT